MAKNKWLRRLSTASHSNFTRFRDSDEVVPGPTDEPPGGQYGPDYGDDSHVSSAQSRVDLTNADAVRTIYINDPVCEWIQAKQNYIFYMV